MFDDDFDMESEEQPSKVYKESNNTSDTVQDSRDPSDQTSETLPEVKARLCPGHERALPIQQTVMDLDVKEEGKTVNVIEIC